MQGERRFVILSPVKRLAIFFLAVALAGVVSSSTTAMATRPALRLSDDTPMTLQGSGFRSGEHVKVTVVAGKRAVHWVWAGSAGGFLVRFRGLTANACRGSSAIAVGDRGSYAAFKRVPGVCPA
jgi:hypothetical protein